MLFSLFVSAFKFISVNRNYLSTLRGVLVQLADELDRGTLEVDPPEKKVTAYQSPLNVSIHLKMFLCLKGFLIMSYFDLNICEGY